MYYVNSSIFCQTLALRVSLKYASLGHWHRRRLVINIGEGKNLGQKYWGAKIFGKYIFRQHSKKIPFYSQKFLMTFFSHQQLFQKMTPFIQNGLPFLCIFLFLCLCFCFLSCFIFLYNFFYKFSFDYWGGAKKGFCPCEEYITFFTYSYCMGG